MMLLVRLAAAMGAGPAQTPEKWPDYGGTPDIAVPEGMGLTVDEIRQILDRFKSSEYANRVEAFEELRKNAAGSEAAFREVLWGRHSARNAQMKQAIREARRRAPDSDGGDALLSGLLLIGVEDPSVGQGVYAALRIYAMLCALNELNSMAGYKVMIDFSPRHAGIFRHEIGRMLVAHKLDALPALIYGRGSANEEIHMFAVKWIRDMGDPLLSEQVRMKSSRRLAQLLEAYASVNELVAVDVTLSLTNHESVFVRSAARACIEVYGKNAKWPARRLYENTFGQEPPEEADVSSVLQRIYRHFDERRLAQTTEVYTRGKKAFKAGRLDEMAEAYRKVLRDAPMFPLRHEMVEGLLARADELEQRGRPDEAAREIVLAYRVAESGSVWANRAEARLKWLEARELLDKGVAVPDLFAQVLKSDPDHEEAKRWLDRFAGDNTQMADMVSKIAIVSLFVFLAGLLTYLRMR